jgi:hypothetical protein
MDIYLLIKTSIVVLWVIKHIADGEKVSEKHTAPITFYWLTNALNCIKLKG